MPGRKEKPIPDAAPEAIRRFAQGLRDLRAQTGRDYRSLAEATPFDASTLSRAASGESFPSKDVTLAYVAALGGDTKQWGATWERVNDDPSVYTWLDRRQPLPVSNTTAGSDDRPLDLHHSLQTAGTMQTLAGESALAAENTTEPSRRRLVWLYVGLAAALVLAVLGIVMVRGWSGDSPPQPQRADASRAEPDITSDGRAVVLPTTSAGRCDQAVEGSRIVDEHTYEVAGTVVAVLRTSYGAEKRQGCAKLIKPTGSPYVGIRTHLALTLCGDSNSCDHDWNAYPVDAGPVVIPSQDGCLSYRVSMLDRSGNDWIVRQEVGWVGCQ